MIDIDKYEGHTKEEWQFDGETVFYHRNGKDVKITQPIVRGDCDVGYYEDAANTFLIADAPLLLAEVKWLYEDINQIPIDLHESLDLILEAHHPEVRESVMAMFGDAIGIRALKELIE